MHKLALISFLLMTSCLSPNNSTNIVMRGIVEYEGPVVNDTSDPSPLIIGNNLNIADCVPSARKVVSLTGYCAPSNTTLEISSSDMIPSLETCPCIEGQYNCGPVEFPGNMINGLNPAIQIKNITFTQSNIIQNNPIRICGNDLKTVLSVNNSSPLEGDTVVFTITSENFGPGDLTNLEIVNLLPAGLTYLSYSSTKGGYNFSTGTWDLGRVENAEVNTLEITAKVGTGLVGTSLVNKISNISFDQEDIFDNDTLEVVLDFGALPVAGPMGTVSFLEDNPETITLVYSDTDGDLATGCSIITKTTNITLSSCTCDILGVCKAIVQGVANFNGLGENFTYQVTTAGSQSNTASVNLSINAVNDPPTIALDVLGNKTTNEDIDLSVDFDINDIDSTLACGSVTTDLSTFGSLISNISFSGTAPDCSAAITLVDDASGTASNLTFSISDGLSSASTSFDLIINAVNDPPKIQSISDFVTSRKSLQIVSFTISDIDSPVTCSDVNVQSNSNTTLIPSADISIGGSGTSCSFSAIPALNEKGESDIVLVLTDGALNDTEGFKITVYGTPFVSTWNITSASETITLPLPANGNQYDFNVDWGDSSPLGYVTSRTDPDRIHTYASPGVYTITITGKMESIRLWNTPERLKILSIPELGDVDWKSFFGSFEECLNLTTVEGGDTSEVTTMQSMFRGSINVEPITTNWDTSNVTNMGSMFFGTDANPNTSSWNTANVTNMSYMFANTTSANPVTSGWDTGNVTEMQSMFSQSDVANPNTFGWDVSKVENMHHMFFSADMANPNVSSWDVSSVTDMGGMFSGTYVANPVTELWDTSNVIDMDYMFYATDAADPDVADWDVSKVTNMKAMFSQADIANPDVSEWDVGMVSDMEGMFAYAILATPDVSSWDVSNVTTMRHMFFGASVADPETDNWDVTSVGNMYRMFIATNISNQNYSNFLININDLIPTAGLNLGDVPAAYQPAAVTARTNLLNEGWSFTDDGPE